MDRGDKLRFVRPTFPDPADWLDFFLPAHDAKHYTNFGPVNRRFEEALIERFAPTRRIVTTASATAGITAVLQSLGLRGPVVMPSFTFPATAQAVLMAGCTPMFCDCSVQTWGLDPAALNQCLKEQPSAGVIYVRAFGFGHDLGEIETITRRHGVPLIIDAASALGVQIDQPSRVGLEGTAEIFSLHATKVFGIGEGGAVFIDPELERGLRMTTNFALEGTEVTGAGCNAKLSEVHAAIGLSVLQRLPDFVRHRRRVAARYHAELCGHTGIAHCWPETVSPWQCFPLMLERGLDAGEMVARAATEDVELRRYYYLPLHQTRAFGRFAGGPLPVTEDMSPRVLCLPVYSDMTGEEQARVIEVVHGLVA